MMAADTSASTQLSQANGSIASESKGIDPYETDCKIIPEDDPFRRRSTQYGRYEPSDDDFKPRYDGWYQDDPNAIEYWEDTVRNLSTPENSLNMQGARHAYAAGSVIIRVDQDDAVGAAAERFSSLNANELSASRKVEEILGGLGVAVPKIFYCGTVSGRNVTVESRIPGVSLDVAWRYLAGGQVELLKEQCRRLLQRLSKIDTGPGHPSYVCSGLNAHLSSEVESLKRDILFNETGANDDLSFVHNNMLLSNVIVDGDRVVGLIGWRDAGYFGFKKANRLHRQTRIPEILSEPELQGGVGAQTWADLYDGLESSTSANGSPDEHSASADPVKIEPSTMSLEKVPLDEETEVKPGLPQLEGIGTLEEHPTPKKVASLKNRGNSRASSADRSSPAPSTKVPAKRAPPGTKKGTGKKVASKKRKLDDQDNESVASHRSNTPVSSRTSKAPGTKKQNSASVANSPAPEKKEKKSKSKKKAPKKAVVKEELEQEEEEEEEEASESDENAIFCICRKPDNHTWMIACDGGCEDWFHGKCVNVDPGDVELIVKYICPNCKANGKGSTAWKPMCRLSGCRKPARFVGNASKYCSDEHGLEFMRRKTQHLNLTQSKIQKPLSMRRAALSGTRTPRDDDSEYDGSHVEDERDDSMEDLGSRGGVLTVGDLTAVIMGVASAADFRKLGAHIISPPPEDTNADAEAKPVQKLGLDVGVDDPNYSTDEAEKIEKLRKQHEELVHRGEMLAARSNFLNLVRQRSKNISDIMKKKEPKGGWKDYCGFDPRLGWADQEFDEWRLSDIGKKALDEGTPEALASSFPDAVDADGDTTMDGEDDIASLTRGICPKKRCERHKQWVKVQQQDSVFEETTLKEDLAACEKEAQGVVERAVLRMWAEKGNAQNSL
ncbi:hypothetical protein BJX99DRAFT_86784 [Aspergillus californicus]